MKLLLDMNMPRRWLPALELRGHEARLWREVGDRRASSPSVVLIRAKGAELDALLQPLLQALTDSAEALNRDALMSFGPRGARVRVLPLPRDAD